MDNKVKQQQIVLDICNTKVFEEKMIQQVDDRKKRSSCQTLFTKSTHSSFVNLCKNSSLKDIDDKNVQYLSDVVQNG